MAPISSFSGLASGVQWRDLIDQIMQAEQARSVDPVNKQIDLQGKRRTAWDRFQTLVTKLGDAAKGLQTGTAFSAFKTSVGVSPTTNRTLFAATASATATPGTYKVEVLDLARTEKLSGNVVSSAETALGVSGDFVVNGKRVDVLAEDTLNTIRDKINATNSGTGASRVSASVLSTGSTAHRLVLSSDVAGSAGIDLVDGTTGVLRQLGIVDSTTVANSTADGGTQTQQFSSTTTAVGTLLGVTVPPATTITVGGKSVDIDLSVDSLDAITAKIQAAGGTAQTTSETVGGVTEYRLVAGGTVSAGTADGQRALELLGFVQGGRSAVAQSTRTENTLTDSGGLTATTSTAVTELGTNGAAGSVAVGDTFTIRGTRADGSAVDIAYTVAAGDTIQTVLDRINSTTDGFGAGSRPATATLDGGRIRLTDAQGGDSQLSLSITANNEGGGTLNFGRANVETVGRLREVVAGSDAQIRVDGVLIARATNTISDSIAGVTLTLQQAELGTTVDLTVTRDEDAAIGSVKAFATAYNDVVGFLEQQRATGQPLYANSTLRSAVASFTTALQTEVATAGSYTRATLVGVSLTRSGTIEVDETKLKEALTTSLTDVKTLFGDLGVGKAVTDAATQVTRFGTGTVATQLTSIDNSVGSLTRRAEDLQRRLDDRQAALIAQFTQMELAMSRLQSQGSWLNSQLQALQGSR